MTVREVCDYTGYSRQTIHKWDDEGLIVAVEWHRWPKQYLKSQVDSIIRLKGKSNGKRGSSMLNVKEKLCQEKEG